MKNQPEKKDILLSAVQQELTLTEAKPIFLVVCGSRMYGFPSKNSDWDIHGAFAYPLNKILGIDSSRNSLNKIYEKPERIDLDLKEIRPFLISLLHDNVNYFESLYSPLILKTGPEHDTLRELCNSGLSKRLFGAYNHLALNTWKEGKNTGKLKKWLCAARWYLAGKYLFETGKISSDINNLNEQERIQLVNEMVEAKKKGEIQQFQGNLDLLEIELDKMQKAMNTARDKSSLPEFPSEKNKKHLEEFLLYLRRKNY